MTDPTSRLADADRRTLLGGLALATAAAAATGAAAQTLVPETTLEGVAARLADEAAIVALRVALGHALDTREWTMMGGIFAPEVDVDMSSFGVPAGRMPRADLVAIYQHAFRHDHVQTFQAYSNFQVTVEDDRATMISLLHGHHVGEGFEGGSTFDLRARYRDGLVRTSEGWRIDATKLEVIAIQGNMALVT